MPAITLQICRVPITIKTRSRFLIDLFKDYFRYYKPRIFSGERCDPGISIELQVRRRLPARERLIPAGAEKLSQTGVIGWWREVSGEGERFYFDLGVAAFRADPRAGKIVGLVTREALEYPHLFANTYTLFPLLLLLRWRGIYHLHAAAVTSPHDELWLICGAQRAGKSTLTTALGLSGWSPVSDDSLLLSFDRGKAKITALRKYFHLGDELLNRWPELAGIARHDRYFDRTCVGGLEFFESMDLAERVFERIDHIIAPQIADENQSRRMAISSGEALLKLAEQSMFFQLWRDHTERQWLGLADLARGALAERLIVGRDLLDDPHLAGRLLE